MIIDEIIYFDNLKYDGLNKDILVKLIKKHERDIKNFKLLESYYLGKHDINNRKRDSTLPNNKVTSNFAKYITDMAVGYLLGNPVTYTANQDIDKITDCYYAQGIARIDTELAKMLSIYGVAYELLYTDENAQVYSTTTSPSNTFVVYNDTVEHKKLCSVKYYIKSDIDDTNKRYVVLLYTKDAIYTYESIDKTLDNLIFKNTTQHYFGDVPVIEYINNAERQGDFEQVISIIDAYNILQSDRINDKEQFVNAFLVLMGIDVDSESAEKLKAEKILCAPDGGDAKYLCKGLTESDTEVLRKGLVDDIHKFSLVPDLNDNKFGGNLSGVAIRYKLLAFEQLAKNKEQYFSIGLRERFGLYNYFLNIKSVVPIVPQTEIEPVFKRNLPVNEYEISQMIVNLKNMVSDETLLGRLPFVTDPSEEVKLVEQEQQRKLNNLTDMGGFNE